MRKKRLIALGALLFAFVAIGMIVFWPRDPAPQVQVVGNFSPEDVTAIKRAVRHQMWQEAVPGFSWNRIKTLAGALKRNATERLVRIDQTQIVRTSAPMASGTTANATFTPAAQVRMNSGREHSTYLLEKHSNDWHCLSAYHSSVGWVSVVGTNNNRKVQSGTPKQAGPGMTTNWLPQPDIW